MFLEHLASPREQTEGKQICLLPPQVFFRTGGAAGARGGPVNADGFAFLILSPTSTHPFNGSVRQFSNFKGSCSSEKGAVDNREDKLDS